MINRMKFHCTNAESDREHCYLKGLVNFIV